MFLSILVLLGKILAVLIFFLIAVAAYHNMRARATISRLVKQGMYDYPSNGMFFFGMVLEYVRYGKFLEENSHESHSAPMRWLLDEIEGTPKRFNSRKYPLVILNRMSEVHIMNSDP